MEAAYEFAVGTQVLAYDNGLLYNAKCLKRRKTEYGQIEYLIHYSGFNSKLDKWLDDDEVLAINDINMGHKDRLYSKVKNLRRSYKKKNETNSSFPKEKELRKRGRPRKIKSIHTEPAVVQAVENKAAVIIKTIPCVQVLINRFNSINVPFSLRRTLVFDFIMNNKYHMCLKFPEVNCLAEVVHTFTQSSYFVDDSQKKLSTILCGTLIQYFNDNVKTLILLDNEKRCEIHKKAKKYFQQRLKDRQDIINIFKNILQTKKIVACYVYGPMYLLRLLVNLPTIWMRNSKLPDCDIDTFVLYIKGLYQFLEKNLDMYFPIDDYIKM